jgi:hypothetical protein
MAQHHRFVMISSNKIKAHHFRQWIILLLIVTTRSCADAQTTCQDLNCLNGGYCSESTPGAAKCFCPPFYIGDNCGQKTTSLCNANTGKCMNGVPCTSDLKGCDCSAVTSTFARYMCEQTATEYCTEGHFCTNGGTCLTNLGKQMVESMPGL